MCLIVLRQSVFPFLIFCQKFTREKQTEWNGVTAEIINILGCARKEHETTNIVLGLFLAKRTKSAKVRSSAHSWESFDSELAGGFFLVVVFFLEIFRGLRFSQNSPHVRASHSVGRHRRLIVRRRLTLLFLLATAIALFSLPHLQIVDGLSEALGCYRYVVILL